MPSAVLIEVQGLDETGLRRRLDALGQPGAWQLEPRGRSWLLWLDESLDCSRLCAGLLACGRVRQLDFVGP